jgi:predicted O-methyltransferase YrrM
VNLPPHDWHAPIIAGIVGAYSRFRQQAQYVEIGVDRGYTLAHVATANPGVRMEGCDVTLGNIDPRTQLRDLHNVTLRGYGSDQFWKITLLRPDVVFIDGDHSKVQVERDLAGALSKLQPDGTIIVHDTRPERQEWAESHCGDGWRAIVGYVNELDFQVFTLPLFPGLTFIGSTPELSPS